MEVSGEAGCGLRRQPLHAELIQRGDNYCKPHVVLLTEKLLENMVKAQITTSALKLSSVISTGNYSLAYATDY